MPDMIPADIPPVNGRRHFWVRYGENTWGMASEREDTSRLEFWGARIIEVVCWPIDAVARLFLR